LDLVLLPRWLVIFLIVLALGLGLSLPWLATWTGALHAAPPPAQTEIPDLRPEMIELPGGTFTMGSPGEVGMFGGQTAHQVTVSAFAICLTEVTQGQWEAVMGSNPSDCRVGCGNDLPVQSVSWLDAVGYLNRLTELEGERLEPCYEISGETVRWPNRQCTGYRLPTEAEWEYAARAGTTTRFSFGDDDSGLEAHAWYGTNSGGRVHPVGTKEPNAWRLRDVHGNVWEWVWDWYEPYSSEPASDPTGTQEGIIRVLRGGSFGVVPGYLRSAFRVRLWPGDRRWDYGFRCARSPRPQP
jgi:formylglycine-generating enzyme required for sulfatase activity